MCIGKGMMEEKGIEGKGERTRKGEGNIMKGTERERKGDGRGKDTKGREDGLSNSLWHELQIHLCLIFNTCNFFNIIFPEIDKNVGCHVANPPMSTAPSDTSSASVLSVNFTSRLPNGSNFFSPSTHSNTEPEVGLVRTDEIFSPVGVYLCT